MNLNKMIEENKNLHLIGKENSNIDCGDFTDRLHMICTLGKKIIIKPTQEFNLRVMEYGQIKENYTYHSIYVYKNLAFDPRYSENPVNYVEYTEKMKEINNGNIVIEEE